MADHVEIKCTMRSLFMSKVNQEENLKLAKALSHSRLSSQFLFGEIPESFQHSIVTDQNFPGFVAPSSLTFADPSIKKSFQNSPSGNRGTSKGFKQSFANRNSSIKRGARKSRASFLTSKNVQAGGQFKSSQMSTQTTRGGGSSTRGSKTRGGKTYRGKGRGKFNKKL